MKKILVVEDDDFFRDTICEVLKDKYSIIQAPNGKSACEILSIQDVDLVLTDVQMPNFTGVDLLEWSKINKPVPFVIMTGFSTLLQTKSAFDLGAKGFISKPFKLAELLTILNSLLGDTTKAKVEEKSIQLYCKVLIDDFVAKPKIDFDVYIKLSDSNIIKIANKNQELPRDLLTQYKLKGLKYLYILKDDFNKLIEFNLNLAKLIKNRTDVSQEKKMNFLKYTGDSLLERTFVDGISDEDLAETNLFIKLAVNAVTDSNENFELLSILNNHSDHVYADSVAVSMYSILMAKELGIESSVTQYKIFMAGMFHDIGKKEIDPNLFLKPRHLITKDERQLIESHVVRGYEILSTLKTVPSEVSRIVYEHHEDQQGLGYPLRKTKKDQHPLSKIIQCSSIFLETINISKMEGTPIVVSGILDHMLKIYEGRIDLQCIQALKKVFNAT